MKTILITSLLLFSLNLQAQKENDLIHQYDLAMEERKNYDESEQLEILKQKLSDFLFARDAVKEQYELADMQTTFKNDKQKQKYLEEYNRMLFLLKQAETTTLQEYLNQYELCKRLFYTWYVKFPIYNLNRGYELYVFDFNKINDYKDLVSYKDWYNENKDKNGTKKSYKVF